MPSDPASTLAGTDWSKYQTLAKYFPPHSASIATSSVAANDDAQPVSQNTVQATDNQSGSAASSAQNQLDILEQLLQEKLANSPQAQGQTSDQPAPAGTIQQKEKLLPVEAATVESGNAPEALQEGPAAVEKQPTVEPERRLKQEIAETQEIAELDKEIEVIETEQAERDQAEAQKDMDKLANAATTGTVANDKPVVILPISQSKAQEAKGKDTKHSLRWLWEWCEKIAKIFTGSFVYKEEVTEN